MKRKNVICLKRGPVRSRFLWVLCILSLIAGLTACQSNEPEDEPLDGGAVNFSQDSSGEELTTVTEAAGDTEKNYVIEAIMDTFSAKEFVEAAVDEADLRLILQSGAKAPSARNMQPWHFTVVQGETVKEVLSLAVSGNVVIVISGMDDAGEGIDVSYDCASAVANMYLAAQSLGYGAHIYTGGVDQLNQDSKEDLGIPDGFSAVAILQIGQVENYMDAVASATPRNPLEEMVNYVGQ